MKSRGAIALAMAALAFAAAEWQIALPGYRYEFPRDHFEHPGYRTEWWYYTGNVRAQDGHRFGFELTFFRQAIPESTNQASEGIWNPNPIYFAHLALSDIGGHAFYQTQRLNRAGPGLAGASFAERRYWNGNWQVHWATDSGEQDLQAVCERFTLQLHLRPEKPFVINGQNGVSVKGPLPGEASHYISFTRLRAKGALEWKNSLLAVEGLAWMDHEFFSEPEENTLMGWDWFAIQLDNDEELMLYRLRRRSEEQDPWSSGTYVDTRGQAHFLSAADFSLTPLETWASSASGARYPIAWRISVPSLGLELNETTPLPAQELAESEVSPSYWEGAVSYNGRIHGQPVRGVGYLEMTGYARAVNLGRSGGSR